MGITGLLPFLSKSSRRANISEFAGQTVAVDAYCWLHKGAFSCADKLVMNQPTLTYVSYCMKYINMLLYHNIKPILVFDGMHLPAKAETEKKRRESRALNKKRGAELLRAGLVSQGRNYLRRAVDITHEMALNLIKECRSRNIDCIIAPYEADAQLAYFSIKNIAQVVITEDSDLLLFGCVKVLFKMDLNGNGQLIEKDRIHVSMGIRYDSFSIDKFRHMCILSGCDYLPSLPGIGLGKALKFIKRTNEQNIYEALQKLPARLQMSSLVVSDDYRNKFIEADRTFKYQLVYDPMQRKQVPLNETENENNFVGKKLDKDVAFQLAVGNLDPITLKQMDSYNPDKTQLSVKANTLITSHQSIWSGNFSPKVPKPRRVIFPVHSSTKGITISTSLTPAIKRPLERDPSPERPWTKEFLFKLYSPDRNLDIISVENADLSVNEGPQRSPILFKKSNPFSNKFAPLNTSNKKRCLSGLAHCKLDFDSDELVNSRYFSVKQNDESPASKKSSSVLGLLDEEQNSSWKTSCDESRNEDEKCISHSEGSGESNNDLDNSSTEIQRTLSKFFISPRTTDSKDNRMVFPQEDNPLRTSNTDKLDDHKEADNSLGCFTPKMTVLAPSNRVPSHNNFYTLEMTSENCGNTQTSPYFAGKNGENISVPVVSSTLKVPIKGVKSLSRPHSKKKTLRNISKCNEGKQQSLLTRFGFQPRAKLQTDKL